MIGQKLITYMSHPNTVGADLGLSTPNSPTFTQAPVIQQ